MKNKVLIVFALIVTTILLIGCSSSGSNSSANSQIILQAQSIYSSMTESEKIGQLIMPSYLLLAQSPPASITACTNDLQTPNPSAALINQDCGLAQIGQYHLGAVLTGGGPYLNAPTVTNWAQLNAWATASHARNGGWPQNDPLLLTGCDATHLNMHVQGAVMGPQDIGLGATHDLQLVDQVEQLAAQDALTTGFNWIYMPTIAQVQDLRWGRTYEGFSSDPTLLKSLAAAYIEGLQIIQGGRITGVLATAKHFLGDGGTQYGLDEGNDNFTGTMAQFWTANGQGYEAAVRANVGSIMVSYSAINGDNSRMHFGGVGSWDIINTFKNQGITDTDGQNYQFLGFMVSDWNGSTRAAYFYDQANPTEPPLTLPQIYAKSINAGIDMLMVGQGDSTNPLDPSSPPNFSTVGEVVQAVTEAYATGLISETRLHDAVMRILEVKLSMNPKSAPLSNYSQLQAQERAVALQLAKESLILLKNNNATLPLTPSTIKNVVFIGDTDDLGVQNGGWTINWQGQEGSQYFTGVDQISSGAMTLESGIIAALGDNVNYYHVNPTENDMPLNLNAESTVAISIVAEIPYAEYMGDIGNPNEPDVWYNMGAANGDNLYESLPQNQFLGLQFDPTESSAIQNLRSNGVKIITVVYSGRPMVIGQNLDGNPLSPMSNSDAVIAAFLPGTTGGTAITDAIFGNYLFTSGADGQSNTLPFKWPRDMLDVTTHFALGNLFDVGYGLSD